MQIHDLIQGSPEWDQFRLDHDGASEAAPMLGLSKKATRTDLLHMKHTGIAKEFSDWVQENILDNGHRVEALARPIVAKKIGKQLYPVTCSEGRMSASCDGLTMDETIAFEHKQWNEVLAESVRNGIVPDDHMPQCQQIMLVTGAEKVIFTVSDGTEENIVYAEVLPDQAWFDRILAGWAQFHKDLAEYVPQVIAEKPQAEAMMALPALFVQARGEITESNMEAFGEALALSLEKARAAPLVTDQDFSNAEAAAKLYRETCKKLMLAKDAMLEQTLTIGAAARMIDTWHEDLRVTALKLEKDVEREKEAKKLAIITAAKLAWGEHTSALEAEIKPMRIDIAQPDFAGAMKGKRLVSAWQDAVNTALANAKIEADAIAKDIRQKQAWCRENAEGFQFLFADMAQIITKADDDFKLLVTSRINTHKEAEAKRQEEERERIRIEEEAKAKAKVEAEQAAARQAAEQREREEAAELLRKADEAKAKPNAQSEDAPHKLVTGDGGAAPLNPADYGTHEGRPDAYAMIGAIGIDKAPAPDTTATAYYYSDKPSAQDLMSTIAKAYKVKDAVALGWLRDANFAAVDLKLAA